MRTAKTKDKMRKISEKMRGCIQCSCEFLSSGPGHRICPKCKKRGTLLEASKQEKAKVKKKLEEARKSMTLKSAWKRTVLKEHEIPTEDE